MLKPWKLAPSWLHLAAASAAASTACVCPPCVATVETKPVAVGDRLVLWDGDGENLGSTPKGWESCDAKPCVARFGIAPGKGKDDSNAVSFHVDGAQWLGGGWNLFGWWPEDAGIDVSAYDTLQFMVRIEADSPDLAPADLTTGLGGSGDNNSGFASVAKFDKNFADGKWHVIEVPLTELMKGEGKNFNPQSVWEFRLNTWNATPKKFDAYVDEISVVKRR